MKESELKRVGDEEYYIVLSWDKAILTTEEVKKVAWALGYFDIDTPKAALHLALSNFREIQTYISNKDATTRFFIIHNHPEMGVLFCMKEYGLNHDEAVDLIDQTIREIREGKWD